MQLEINKNTILLYALLNRFDQALGDANTTELRSEMVEYFKDYSGTTPVVGEYIHTSKCFFWCVSVSEVPKFEPKKLELNRKQQFEFNSGKKIKPYLLEFYENSKFEEYYIQLLPELKKIYAEFREEFKEGDFKNLLETIWEVKSDSRMVVILNPFTQSSFGPKIGGTNYQMLGMWGDRKLSSYSHNIIHEGSHPYAKEVLKPFLNEIENIAPILEKAYKDPNYPKSYRNWSTCFEEHLIRAVHGGLINPKIKKEYNLEKNLNFERDRKGMIFIHEFYEILKDSDSVATATPRIIEYLKKKCQSNNLL